MKRLPKILTLFLSNPIRIKTTKLIFFCQTRRTHQNRNEHDSCKSEPLCNSPILEGSKLTNEELMDTSVSHRWPQVCIF